MCQTTVLERTDKGEEGKRLTGTIEEEGCRGIKDQA